MDEIIKYYKDYKNSLILQKIDLSYDEEFFNAVRQLEISIDSEPVVDDYMNIDVRTLDSILYTHLSLTLDERNSKDLKKIISSKIIDSTSDTNYTIIDNDNSYIVLNQYSSLKDISKLVHELTHVCLGNNNEHFYSELLPIAHEYYSLIVLDDLLKSSMMKKFIVNKLHNLKYYIELINECPDIAPVIMPYIYGVLTADKVSKMMLTDEEKYKFYYYELIDKKIMMKDFIRIAGLEKIDINNQLEIYKKILSKA